MPAEIHRKEGALAGGKDEYDYGAAEGEDHAEEGGGEP